ncbi:hypothetical protein HPB50_022778 [Hyalomma asiaticum]|uniref:Uncharacterized protein n=1 Tax=Hyalomma asiaticum TaxID=266040 RepID=A0ACB7TM55_HYAAI|nr:hypothetical protein HPB50_022778 [Hyalomma asiaticum]
MRLKLHWLLHGVSDEDTDGHTGLVAFGKVVEVSRERWRVQGMAEKCSTTRTVLVKLKSGFKVEDLPRQLFRLSGELALVFVSGRPRQCLHCQGTRHVRRVSKLPRCSRCRRFRHVEVDFVKMYASPIEQEKNEGLSEHVIDAAETEDAAEGTGRPVFLVKSTGKASAEVHEKAPVEPQLETGPLKTGEDGP